MIQHFYVGAVPETEINYIPADVIDLLDIANYGVTSISGLTRPKATINRSVMAGANTSRINSAQVAERNIVLDIEPQGGELARQTLYDILPFDAMLRFYIETEYRKVFVDGYIETIDGDDVAGKLFGEQVSIICPFPWFQSVQLHTAQLKTGDNIVYNRGDIPAGFRWYVEPVADKVRAYEIKLTAGGETFATKPDKVIVAAAELITVPGKKYFHCVTNSVSSQERPAFSLLTANSAWPQIPAGEQTVTLTYTNDSPAGYTYDDMNTLYWRDTFSGV